MNQTFLLAVMVFVFVIAFVAGMRVFVSYWRRKADRSEYRPVPLLSIAEATFYRCLVELHGSSVLICPKVRLLDLIRPCQGLGKSQFQIAFNRVSRKHVDFVLLRREDLAVLGVVELDDRSHEAQSQKDRDEFVDDALGQAGIRVCRIKAKRQYDLQMLGDQLDKAFAEVSENAGA